MRRTRLDRDSFNEIMRRRYYKNRIDSPTFAGTVSLLCIDEVWEEKYWSTAQTDVPMIVKDLKWLQIKPDNTNYVATVIYDQEDNICMYMFEIFCNSGIVNNNGQMVTYIEENYLKIILLRNNEKRILGMQELETALFNDDITKEEYNNMLFVKDKLLASVCRNSNFLRDYANSHYTAIKKKFNI